MNSPFAHPIPLSSIERMYFYDSSARYPNRVACRILIEHPFDLETAKAACFWVGERHPILGCGIEPINGRLCWKRDRDFFRLDQTNNRIKWFHFEKYPERPARGPDFVQLLGSAEFYRPCILVRQWNQSHSNPANAEKTVVNEIWVSIHHAFCDGAGGIQLISDWIQIYENLMLGREPFAGLPAVDHDQFLRRNKLGLSSWKFLRVLPIQLVGLYGTAKFVFRKSINVLPVNAIPPSSSTSNALAVVGGWLSGDEVDSLERTSQRESFNANAKYLGDLFVTLESWYRKRIGESGVKEWVRIFLPINLREMADRRLPAANRSSLIQIDRRNTASTPDFYRLIQREIGIVLRFQLDRMFLIMVRMLSVSNSLLKRAVRKQKPRGLAVFTNLGRPFRRLERRPSVNDPGGLVNRPQALLQVREFDFLAPIRFGTPLNFTISHFQRRTRITLHYDSHVIPILEAEHLLNQYLTALRQPGFESLAGS